MVPFLVDRYYFAKMFCISNGTTNTHESYFYKLAFEKKKDHFLDFLLFIFKSTWLSMDKEFRQLGIIIINTAGKICSQDRFFLRSITFLPKKEISTKVGSTIRARKKTPLIHHFTCLETSICSSPSECCFPSTAPSVGLIDPLSNRCYLH